MPVRFESQLIKSLTNDDSSGWITDAACKGIPTIIFFPEKGKHYNDRTAKAFCLTCTVSDKCLRFAMENTWLNGIWGGTNEDDRKKLRRLKTLF